MAGTKFTLFITIICYILFSVIVFINALPSNPLSLNPRSKKNLVQIIPQGWSFFTRNPKEEQVVIYNYDTSSKKLRTALSYPNSNIKNLWGLQRTARIQSLEYGKILYNISIKDSDWVSTRTELATFLKSDSIKIFETINDIGVNSLCGELIFVKTPVIPFSWRVSRKSLKMPYKVIKVKVKC